jgi:hypothetical protein
VIGLISDGEGTISKGIISGSEILNLKDFLLLGVISFSAIVLKFRSIVFTAG